MLTRRDCPVIWPGKSGPLSDQKLDQYKEEGYLFFPDFLAKDDPALLAACVENRQLLLSSSDRKSFIAEENSSLVRSVFDALTPIGLMTLLERWLYIHFSCQSPGKYSDLTFISIRLM
jgi:hypothetical protein